MRSIASTVAAVTALLALAGPAAAVEDRPFAQRFAINDRGDIVFAANGLMTCPDAAPGCAAARAGTASGAALNNNAYAMQQVDTDADPSTFNSSSSTLALPAGAQVLFAGLYYGARTNAATRGTALLRGPADAGYVPVTAAVDASSAIPAAYTAFADVTGRVRAQGGGSWTVANVQAGTGPDRYAGWALVVAYRLAGDTPRHLSVFDGLSSVDQADPIQEATVSGLETPPSGVVRSRVGVVTYEGDRGVSGTPLFLQGRQVSDAANPPNNVFNSTIATDGLPEGGRVPAYPNLLGFDADLIRADGYLANGATSARVRESTTTEQYLTQVLTLSTDLDPSVLAPPAPSLPVATADLGVDTTPPPAPLRDGGDSTYTVDVTNNGPAQASGVELTYTFTGPVDVRAASVDRGSCVVAARTVTCTIGTLAPGGRARVRIRVRPTDTGTIGRRLTVRSDSADPTPVSRAATSRVRPGRAAVAVAKRASVRFARPGQVVTYRIVVRATSRARARGLRVCDRPGRGIRLLSARKAKIRGNTACWRVAELASGRRRTFSVVARLNAPRASRLVNRATVAGSNTASRSASARVRVSPLSPRACTSARPRARAAC